MELTYRPPRRIKSLHGPELGQIRDDDALLVEVLDRLLGALQRRHAHERTTNATLRLRSDDEHLEHVAELLKRVTPESGNFGG